MTDYTNFQENKGRKSKKKIVPKKVKKWEFINPNRRVLIGRQEVTQDDLDNDQRMAEILIDRGLGFLLCQVEK